MNRLEILLGNDLIGIDVHAIQRRDLSNMGGKGFHGNVPGSGPMTDIDEVAGHGCRRGHGRGNQVGSPALSLTAFEVSVAR